MTRLALTAALFAICLVAEGREYKEYGNYDLRGAVKVGVGENSEQRFQVDVKLIDRVVNDLAAHAKDYPTNFRTDEEQARAERDAKLLVEMFDELAADKNARAELLLKAAFVDGIAHNLDIPGAAAKAAHHYERVLGREPDHPRANLNYGIFLAGVGKQQESLLYLEKALELGVNDARWTLALVHIALGDKDKAREHLQAYARARPQDKRPQEILEAIDSGTLHVKSVP